MVVSFQNHQMNSRKFVKNEGCDITFAISMRKFNKNSRPKSIPVISVFLCFRKIFPYFSFKYTFMNRTALNRRRKNLANNPKNIFKYSKNNINLSYSNIVASNILRTFTFINSKSNNFCSENRINSVCFLEIRHHWYEHADLNARSLNSELLSNHKFSDVDLIYPDIDLEVCVYTEYCPFHFSYIR